MLEGLMGKTETNDICVKTAKNQAFQPSCLQEEGGYICDVKRC